MARCTDCGMEDISYYLINGLCEDCVEFHNPELNLVLEKDEEIDEDDNIIPLDPVVHLFNSEEW